MHGNRIRLRQELEKQRQELERQKDEEDSRRRREAAVSQQSSTINVPPISQAGNGAGVSLEVPNTILEVRTKLAHPTNYHVTQVQKRQVHQFLNSYGSPVQQSRSAPPQQNISMIPPITNLGKSMGIQNDPLLSGALTGGSPSKSNILKPLGSPMKQGVMSQGMGSPVQPSVLNPAGSGLTTMYGNQPNSLTMKPDSPTMMDQTPEDIQEQIIEDIMGLEEKFGDTLGGLGYLESTMITPQTLPVSSNLFDTFGGGMQGASGTASPIVMAQMSASCPVNVANDRGMMGNDGMMVSNMDVKQFEKERQKKNNHNMIERRRRFNINDRIKELGMLLPATETEARQNKGSILKASVDYIRKLQRDLNKLRIQETKQRQLEDTNRQMRLRIQELELTARAHGIATPSLNPETQKLANAADQALGSITPGNKSPSSAHVTPVNVFGSEDLSDVLRASPGIDLSKLQIKQESIDSPPPNCLGDKLSPSPLHRHPRSGVQFNPQNVGDIFSFNLPMSSAPSTLHPPSATSNSISLYSE